MIPEVSSQLPALPIPTLSPSTLQLFTALQFEFPCTYQTLPSNISELKELEPKLLLAEESAIRDKLASLLASAFVVGVLAAGILGGIYFISVGKEVLALPSIMGVACAYLGIGIYYGFKYEFLDKDDPSDGGGYACAVFAPLIPPLMVFSKLSEKREKVASLKKAVAMGEEAIRAFVRNRAAGLRKTLEAEAQKQPESKPQKPQDLSTITTAKEAEEAIRHHKTTLDRLKDLQSQLQAKEDVGKALQELDQLVARWKE